MSFLLWKFASFQIQTTILPICIKQIMSYWFFLKLRVLLLTDVRNVQCYFQLLIYVSYHVCLCFQILLVTILNLCYFSGSHQTAISYIKETYLLNYTIWLFKTIFCVSIEIKCFPTCTKHLITWKLKTLTNLEVLKY